LIKNSTFVDNGAKMVAQCGSTPLAVIYHHCIQTAAKRKDIWNEFYSTEAMTRG
jgi:hypothetical protein